MDFIFLLINRIYNQIYILKKLFFIKNLKIFSKLWRDLEYKNYFINFSNNGRIEIGNKLIQGTYIFSFVKLDLKNNNIFKNEFPSKEVNDSISSFDWLNDLAVLGNLKAKNTAKNWLTYWLENYSIEIECQRSPNVLSKRQINFVHNLKFINIILSEELFKSITCKIMIEKYFLNFLINDFESDYTKIEVLISSFWLDIFFNASLLKKKQNLQKIEELISLLLKKKLFFENRKPDEILEIFLIITDLINNTENIFKKNKSIRKVLLFQKRLVPLVRGLRLGNGYLTRFHGGDRGNRELMDKALSSTQSKDFGNSSNFIGIERITAGRLIMLLDCNPPPLNKSSYDSHASCLSFELTSGQRAIFVNCGPGGRFGIEYKRFCRNTSAHNTSAIENTSQADFKSTFSAEHFSNEIISRGPKKVNIQRGKSIDAKWLECSHDGYYENFGILHRRKIIFLKSGISISGTDYFKKINKLSKDFSLNLETFFHLHPDVEITNHPHVNSIILRLKNGEHWIFETKIGRPIIKDSIYIDSGYYEPKKTKVIILNNKILEKSLSVSWSLRRREIVSRHTRDLKIINN